MFAHDRSVGVFKLQEKKYHNFLKKLLVSNWASALPPRALADKALDARTHASLPATTTGRARIANDTDVEEKFAEGSGEHPIEEASGEQDFEGSGEMVQRQGANPTVYELNAGEEEAVSSEMEDGLCGARARVAAALQSTNTCR